MNMRFLPNLLTEKAFTRVCTGGMTLCGVFNRRKVNTRMLPKGLFYPWSSADMIVRADKSFRVSPALYASECLSHERKILLRKAFFWFPPTQGRRNRWAGGRPKQTRNFRPLETNGRVDGNQKKHSLTRKNVLCPVFDARHPTEIKNMLATHHIIATSDKCHGFDLSTDYPHAAEIYLKTNTEPLLTPSKNNPCLRCI